MEKYVLPECWCKSACHYNFGKFQKTSPCSVGLCLAATKRHVGIVLACAELCEGAVSDNVEMHGGVMVNADCRSEHH